MQAQLLSPSAISEISKLQNLEDLKLWRPRIDAQGAAAISRCANLKSLVISSPTAGDAELASLHSLNKLVELSLSGTQITDGSAAWIAKLSTLKKLAVSRTLMTVSGVSQFKSLGQLERLSAYELKASPRTEMDFAGWSRDLKELDLTNTDLGDGGLRGIGLLSNLEKVYLGGTKIGDNDIRQLKGLRHLTELQVFELHLTDRSLKEVIPTLTSLVELSADETDISDESVKTLCDHPSLQVITVRKTNITEKGADRLMWHFRLSPGFWLPRE